MSTGSRDQAKAFDFTILISFVVLLAATTASQAQVSVSTYHNDLLRTGWNASETALTVASVSGGTFTLQHAVILDDQVDAQPLYVSNQTISGQSAPHDVVYVATENNTVYAIDAATGAVLLSRNLGPPVRMSSLPGQCPNNGPNVGINSTPVLSQVDKMIWLVTYTYELNEPLVPSEIEKHPEIALPHPFPLRHPVFRLHALGLETLADNVPPVLISATANLTDGSQLRFGASVSRQRAALTYANDSIYVAFASFCDGDAQYSRGWLLRWNAHTLAPDAANELTDKDATTPGNVFLSSIWMSGYGVATSGQNAPLFFVTGNSDYRGSKYDSKGRLAESLVKIAPDLTTVQDYFIPYNAVVLDVHDEDFGSGGVMVLPDGGGPTPRVAVAAGKDGNMFLVNRDHLGGYLPPTPALMACSYPGLTTFSGPTRSEGAGVDPPTLQEPTASVAWGAAAAAASSCGK